MSRVVGESPAARDFFAGRYAKVVAETFDAPAEEIREVDVAFAVGALTFVGRVADAETCFDAWRLGPGEHDPRTLAASRFFLGVAFARSGDFRRAHELLVAGARDRARAADPWEAAFAFQGLSVFRYFTGRYRPAARHARRALRAAHVAGFAYVRMLSTDLRGHALVQMGQLEAGTALLEQGKSQAERLGLGLNAFAIDASIAVYRAKFKVGPEALRDLEALLDRRAHDSYSRRTLLTQAAVQYALRGRGGDATRALEEVDRDALRMDARRAKVTSLLARLHVTRWAHGPRACVALLDEAASWMDAGDVAFRAELFAFALFVAQAIGDDAREGRAAEELRSLARSTHLHVAQAALHAGERAHAFVEDELMPLLRPPSQRAAGELPRLLALGLLGPVPELVGLPPGRGVALLPRENALLVQDHGDVWLRPSPPRWAPPLLRVLAGGASKEAMVAALWGLRRYAPDKHDPLLRTTIHRLRGLLDPRGEWVTVTADGYGLAVPVHVIGAPPPSEPLEAPLPDPGDDEDPAGDAPSYGAGARHDAAAVDRRVLDHLVRQREASVPEIADVLSISESTALRATRRLVRAGKAERSGAARATRYRARG